MRNSTFIGLDVHKATIWVAIAQGERGGEVWAAPAAHLANVTARSDHQGLRSASLHWCSFWRSSANLQ